METKMKILVGYDGSACADSALDDLSRAGLPKEGVEALVVAVAEVWLPPPPPSAYEVASAGEGLKTADDLKNYYGKRSRLVEEAEASATRAATRLRGRFPGWGVTAEAVYGSPAWELVTRADRWEPDLIVVGSHGRTALGRLILGSVSQKVLTEARASVRIARGRVEVEPTPVRLVIGFDGSPGAHAALREVARREWPEGSEAKVLVVADPLVPTHTGGIIPPVAQWVEESNREERERVLAMASEAAESLRAAGLTATHAAVEGDPKRVIVEEAERFGADSVFVGSKGFGSRLERFLLGSVSSAVAARAQCSVEVVRGPK